MDSKYFEYINKYATYKELSSKTILKHLQNANTFINTVLDNYYNNKDHAFKNIKVYGDNLTPLFVPSEIGEILKLSERTLNNKMDKLIFGIHYIDCTYIGFDKHGNPRTQYNSRMLTKFGLNQLISISGTEIAMVFQEFVNIVLSELEGHGKVTLEDSLGYQKEIAEARQKLAEAEALAERILDKNADLAVHKHV